MSYGESTTTTGELSYGDDDDWVFDFFRFGTESVLGFFFLFFLVQNLETQYIAFAFCMFLFFFHTFKETKREKKRKYLEA